MAVLLALAAATFSGSGDFLGGVASRRDRVMPVVLVNHLAGVATVLILGPMFGGSLSQSTIVWGSIAGLSGAMAVVALYSGFAKSSIAVVSPIAAVGAAVWPVLWQIVRGDMPTAIVLGGIVLGLIAIWTISSGGHLHDADNVAVGVRYGLLAGIGFGGLLIFLSLAADASGIWSLLPARVAGSMVMLIVAARVPGPLLPNREAMPPSIGAGVLVTLGNGMFVLATTEGSLAVVSVIAAMFPAATVLLAWLVLGERLTPQRRIGLVLALVAVALVAGG
ncbi:MAG: DMT family transporter [bacterium]|nr:DMT family transporter [bacterium]MCP4965463.1 DMT family transporter [bacterium]